MSKQRTWIRIAISTLLLAMAPAGPVFAQEPAEEGSTPPADSSQPAPQGDGAQAPAAPASAGEGGEAEAAEAEEGTSTEELSEDGGAVEFAQAMEALLLQSYPEAARLAYVSMKKTKPSSEKYESGQFVLAEALAGAGLAQASSEYYFAVAEQRQNPALLPRALAGLEALARRGLLDEEKLLRGVLVEADLANVPPEVSDFLSYYRGISNLRLGYRSWAEKDFALISDGGYYAQLSTLVRVVTLVRDGKTDEATDLVVATLKAEEDAEAEDEDYQSKLDSEIRAKLVLIRARLLYESGRTEEAIKHYKKLRDTIDTEEGEILLERAWAHFRAGDHHDAMGLLYALSAPSSRELFLPDQYIIRGLIYQRFCHFRAAKASVRDFRDRYGEYVRRIKLGEALEQIDVVVNAARMLPEVQPSARVLDAVAKEKALLEDLSGSLEEGGLLQHLAEVYDLLDRRARASYSDALRLGAEHAAESLLEADEQANLLEYEVGVSIFKPIAPSSGEVKLRARAEEVPSHGKMVYFPFDGEFWSDELPYMRFLIQDRCVE